MALSAHVGMASLIPSLGKMGLTFTTGTLIGYLFETGNQKHMVLKNSNVGGGRQLLSNHSLMGDMSAQSHLAHLL